MTRPAVAAPVFVDSTGRRRRLLRRASYVFGGLCLAYGVLVSVSLAGGGPVSPGSILPLQILADGDPAGADPTATPQPTPGPPTSAAPPKPVAGGVPLRHRRTPNHTVERATTGSRSPSVKRTTTPKPTTTTPSPPTTTKPVESTPASTPPATPSTPATAPAGSPAGAQVEVAT